MWIGLYASAFAKTAPALLEHPRYLFSGAQLALSRFFLRFRVPGDGRGARICQVSLRLTDLCNLRCHTCGQWGDNGYLVGHPMSELVADQVTPGRYVELLEDLVRHGHRPGVYLWGGEPFLYGGLTTVVNAAAALGLPTSIATNGTRLEEHAEELVEAPMFLVQVSIDGPDTLSHNACRPGANPGTDNYATVIGGLEAVRAERERRKRRLPILAGLCTINARNAHRLVELYDAFSDRVDVMVFYLAWWIDEEAASRHTQEFLERFGTSPTRHRGWIGGWRPTDFPGLARELDALRRRAMMPGGPALFLVPDLCSAEELERYYTDHGATFGFDSCTSVYRAVEINANGDMATCRDYSDYVVGNVKTHTITELWNSSAYQRFRNNVTRDGLMPACTRCCGLMGN